MCNKKNWNWALIDGKGVQARSENAKWFLTWVGRYWGPYTTIEMRVVCPANGGCRLDSTIQVTKTDPSPTPPCSKTAPATHTNTPLFIAASMHLRFIPWIAFSPSHFEGSNESYELLRIRIRDVASTPETSPKSRIFVMKTLCIPLIWKYSGKKYGLSSLFSEVWKIYL